MPARIRFPARLPDLVADDRTLLGRFADRRDEAAFAALVRRHGPMVLGVCRRAVRDAHLAEDASQAVFVVLARNPHAADRAASVGGWLFGVARRVGLAARRHELRRERREGRAAGAHHDGPDRDWDELLRVLDEELAALPDEYRASLIACYLREQTQDEAARQLGWSLSTLRRRLDRGKELLRARLSRRGATVSAGLFAGALAPSAAPAVPPRLVESLVRVAVGHAPAGPLVSTLAAGGLGHATGVKLAAAVAVLLGGWAAGAAWSASPEPVAVPPPPAPRPSITAVAAPAPPREWVTVKGRVVFPESRPVPKPREILKTDGIVKDAGSCFADGRRLFFEDARIDPDTRGIRNAVVWLRPDADDSKAPFPAGKIHPRLRNADPREHAVDVAECHFVPRVTVARAGDSLRFNNPGPLPTNVKYDTTDAGPGRSGPGRLYQGFNVLLAAKTGTFQDRQPLTGGTVPDRFSSTIYPWMEGHVWAFDHPYAAVTAADGSFTIPDAPVGRWRLVVWHEAGGIPTAHRKPRGQVVTVSAAADAADVGTITLESEQWDKLKPEE